jgi:hypothetical protein
VPKTLVAFHSRGGNTRRIAEEIADAFGADLEEIAALHPPAGLVSLLRDGLGAIAGTSPAIGRPRLRPADYELFVVAAPVWCRRVATPVRTYLRAQSGALPVVGLVCTSRWPGAGHAFEDMARLCHAVPRATLALSAREIAWRQYAASLDAFLRAMQSPSVPQRRLALEVPA